MEREYIAINGNTCVSILKCFEKNGRAITKSNVKPKPPEADIPSHPPVEIVVYTQENSKLSARRMIVSKETVDKIIKIPKLDDRIEELEQLIEMSNRVYQSDDVIYTPKSIENTYFEEMHECYTQIKDLKAKFAQIQAEHEENTVSYDEQYEMEDINIMKFITTLEEQKNSFQITDVIKNETLRNTLNNIVINKCKLDECTERFLSRKKEITASAFQKTIAVIGVLVLFNFILSRSVNLTSLISSLDLPQAINIVLKILGPLAAISGVTFVEYSKYDIELGQLVSNNARRKEEYLQKFSAKEKELQELLKQHPELIQEKFKSSEYHETEKTSVDIINANLSYHPEPEKDFKIKNDETAIAKIQRLKNEKERLGKLKQQILKEKMTQGQSPRIIKNTQYEKRK